MREETGRNSTGSGETDSVEREPPLRFRIEYRVGELIVNVGDAHDLRTASARMAAYDPEGVFDLRVVDNETDEFVPGVVLTLAAAQSGIDIIKDDREKVNWTKEGF